jgi:hypothetical protein
LTIAIIAPFKRGGTCLRVLTPMITSVEVKQRFSATMPKRHKLPLRESSPKKRRMRLCELRNEAQFPLSHGNRTLTQTKQNNILE